MLTTVIIIVSLLFSFFFSGLEIAYISANKLQMYVESRKVSLTGRLFSALQTALSGSLQHYCWVIHLPLYYLGYFSPQCWMTYC